MFQWMLVLAPPGPQRSLCLNLSSFPSKGEAVCFLRWVDIHPCSHQGKCFLIVTSQVALNNPFIGQKLWGGLPSPCEDPGGAIAVRLTVLLWKPCWSSHSPEPALQVPLGPASGTTPRPHPTQCSWHSGKVRGG